MSEEMDETPGFKNITADYISSSLNDRSNDDDRQDDQLVPYADIRTRRPSNPPLILRQPMGKSVRLSSPLLQIVAHASRGRQGILAELEAGTTVVCDRYAFSGIAFSAAKVRSDPPLMIHT